MIQDVRFASTKVRPGETIEVTIEASYPVRFDIYGFLTTPFPAHCVLWPKQGPQTLTEKKPFCFTVDRDIFCNEGFVEFRIVDATGDFRVYDVKIVTKP